MTGPDSIKVPAQSQVPKDAAGFHVSDFISADTAIGPDGSVTGTLHYVKDVQSFPGQSDGYFFPVTLDSKYEGQEITVKGQNEKTVADTEWLLKVTDTNTKFTFAVNKTEVFLTLTFTKVTLGAPVGRFAIKDFAAKTDFGEYGQATDFFDETPTVVWEGINGNVSGKLKKASANSKHGEGFFLPVVVSDWYAEKPVIVYCKNERAEEQVTDWIIRLEDNETPITMKHNGEIVATLDLSGVTLQEG